MRPRDPRDGIHRPLRTAIQVPTSDRGLRDIDGWQILAMYLDGRITASQAQHLNSLRVRRTPRTETEAA